MSRFQGLDYLVGLIKRASDEDLEIPLSTVSGAPGISNFYDYLDPEYGKRRPARAANNPNSLDAREYNKAQEYTDEMGEYDAEDRLTAERLVREGKKDKIDTYYSDVLPELNRQMYYDAFGPGRGDNEELGYSDRLLKLLKSIGR